MSLRLVLLAVALSATAGIAFGYFLRWIISLGRRGSMELDIKQKLLEAQEEAARVVGEAESKATELLETTKKETKEKEEKTLKLEERLLKREEFLDKRQGDLDTEFESLKEKAAETENIKQKAEELMKERQEKLHQVSGFTKDEARKEVLRLAEKNAEEDVHARLRKLEMEGEEKIKERAKEILATSIQRLATDVPAEMMTTTVPIPSEEVKGKIIGKEGRNIKSFERVTGVEVIIDDTPGTISLSSFDPVRRQIARVALEELIKDGRIQPARIEEMVEKAKTDVQQIIKQKGEEAAYECGVFNMDQRVLAILGRLHFRTSYGQNVLQHSIEMAHIARMLAEELGADENVAKTGALLHDIGKALDHEVQGTHVEIGRRILQKFGVSDDVIKAMQAHHGEYPYETVESVIVQVADQISGSRPGARRDTAENYVKRLQELEAIAQEFKGVEKAYALQAGREIRVFVSPEAMGDVEAKELARNIALKIEKDLKYPGEIKITVIRETRITDFAR